MNLFLCVLTVLLFAFSCVYGVDETKFCENYASCLHSLENAQRSCTDFNKKVNKIDMNDEHCNVTKHRLLSDEISNLQIRKTEVLRDCVTKNSYKGVSFLPTPQEHRCLNKASKIDKYVSSHGPLKSKTDLHDPLTKQDRRKKKQQISECQRRRKFLHAKCNQISICCSVSTDCHLSARLVQQQINDYKKEMKALKNDCQKSLAVI